MKARCVPVIPCPPVCLGVASGVWWLSLSLSESFGVSAFDSNFLSLLEGRGQRSLVLSPILSVLVSSLLLGSGWAGMRDFGFYCMCLLP